MVWIRKGRKNLILPFWSLDIGRYLGMAIRCGSYIIKHDRICQVSITPIAICYLEINDVICVEFITNLHKQIYV